MSETEFELAIERAVVNLPEWVKEKIKNVALLVEREPSRELQKEEGLADNETLLGFYRGIPLTERGVYYGVGATMPDTITLFMDPILEASDGSASDIEHIICETVWHEFAHYFGMDEAEVRRREHEREGKGNTH